MRSTRLAISAFTLSAALAGVVSPATAVEPAPAFPYQVTLTASAKLVTAHEDKVVLSGTITPKPPEDSTVVVQAKYEDKKTWRKVGVALVKPNGKYRFVDKPSTHLDRVYRVVKKTDERGLADMSRERAVKVIAWSWLNQLNTSAGEGVSSISSLPINGDTYHHVLYVNRFLDSGFVEYTLGRKCTTFETTFGLSDRTETGGQAAIGVRNDGVSAYLRTFNLGESDPRTFDVTGVYRMRIDFAQVTTTPDTEPAAGDARVLCD